MKSKQSLYIIKLLISAIPFLLITACGIPSVHPLYQAEDLITNDTLTGTWETKTGTFAVMPLQTFLKEFDQDTVLVNRTSQTIKHTSDSIQAEFSVSEDNKDFFKKLLNSGLDNIYLIQSLDNIENFYLGGLVNIENNYYVDFYKIDFHTSQFVYPVHLFMKLSIKQDSLILHTFNQSWLTDLIKNRQVRIKHEVNDNDKFLLTASTLELQKFIAKYGNIKEAYSEEDIYIKINDAPQFIFEDREVDSDQSQ